MMDIKQVLTEKQDVVNKAIEKYIPRKFSAESMNFICGPARYEYHVDASDKMFAGPIWEFLDRGGKRWRPVLFLLTVEALGGDPEKVFDFVVIPEVIHNGSLMHDDIEDSSEYRRGKKCTHLLYGLDVAINAGSSMFFMPMLALMKNLKKFDDKTALKVYNTWTQEMINIHFGQGSDIAWHKGLCNADEVTEGQYLQMCAYKTGTLARMSTKIGAILSGADDRTIEAIGKFSETIGVAFQIQDDILNLIESGVAETKGGVGEDITEGKRTLMVIHTLKKASQEDRKRLVEILNMHTTDQSLRNEAIAIIKKYGAIEYSKEKARALVRESWSEVDPLLKPSVAKEKLKAFADFLVEREI